MADLNHLSDEELQKIADGKMDSLSDASLRAIAGEPEPAAPQPAQSPMPEVERPDSPVMRSMDPFAQMGRQMASPQGKEAMATTGQTIKNLGLEGGGATLGQALGAPFEAVGGMHVGGAIGGFLGNTAGQLTTPGKKFSLGEAVGAGVAGTVPGASLAQAGMKTVAKQAGKYALGNVAAVNAQSMIDNGGAPASLGQDALAAITGAAAAPLSKYLDSGSRATATATAAQKDAYNRETIRLGREIGYTMPPSVVNPGAVNDTLNSLGGKAAVAQTAIHLNQPKTNAAIASEIGLPPGAPISPISINTLRTGPNLVYDKVAKAAPQSAQLLGAYKQANADANELFSAYRGSLVKDPSLLAKARAAQATADTMEQSLSKAVGPDLTKELKDARVQLAKIGLAERAFKGGDFSAGVIGDAFEHGEKLTGNFSKIGRWENRFGKYLKDAAATPPAGVDYLKLIGKGALAGAGVTTGNPALALGGPLAMYAAERGARKAVLTPGYQKTFANPFYGTTSEDISAGIARLGTMSAGRQN